MAKLVFKDHPAHWRTGEDYTQIPLTRVSWDTAPDLAVAYVYFGHVNVDFDGSPKCYAPEGHMPQPLDDLKNAIDKKTDSWCGVVAMSRNDPLVKNGTAKIDDSDPKLEKQGLFPVLQQAKNGDPAPGYYVSSSPRASGPLYLQDSHLNASEVSFGALSGKLRELGFQLGDYGLAIRHDQSLQSGFYFADSGANNHALGECSHHVGLNLGGSGRAKHFNNNYPVSFIVFPGSFTVDPCDDKPIPRAYRSEEGKYALKRCALPAISDADILSEVRPLLIGLSRADNAEELALLMGFNEVAPKHVPRGTSKLATFRKDPKPNLRPINYLTIAQGLRSWGYTMTP
jgi:hypothetical protein